MKNKVWAHPIALLFFSLAVAVALWYLWVPTGVQFARAKLAAMSPTAMEAPAASLPARGASAPGALPPITREEAAQLRATHFTEVGQTGDAFGTLNSLLTAIAGALVFWAGCMQYMALQEARRSAADNLRVATEALLANQRSSRGLVLFTVVGADGLRVPTERSSYRPRVSVRLENVGKSVAVVESFHYCLDFSLEPESTVSFARDPSGQFVVSAEQAGPQVDVAYRGQKPLDDVPERFILRAKDPGAVRFYFYGKVIYQDVFGKRYERDTCIKFFSNRKSAYKFNRERELPSDTVASAFDDD